MEALWVTILFSGFALEVIIRLEPYQTNRKPQKNRAACPVKDIPALMLQIHSEHSVSARAVEFAILTTARSQAVRLATWKEFDLDKKTWIIPRDHDKVKAEKRDRTIFLSSQAIAILRELLGWGYAPTLSSSRAKEEPAFPTWPATCSCGGCMKKRRKLTE